jgi:hypothetical protein
LFINLTILTPRKLSKNLIGLGLAKIVIKVIAEAKEPRRASFFFWRLCHCSFEPVE